MTAAGVCDDSSRKSTAFSGEGRYRVPNRSEKLLRFPPMEVQCILKSPLVSFLRTVEHADDAVGSLTSVQNPSSNLSDSENNAFFSRDTLSASGFLYNPERLGNDIDGNPDALSKAFAIVVASENATNGFGLSDMTS